MTSANLNITPMNNILDMSSSAPVKAKASDTYNRILVFLDGTWTAELALHEGTRLALDHNAELVVVCSNHTRGQDYVDVICRQSQDRGLAVKGYLVAETMQTPSIRLVNSEKVDLVVMTTKTKGWFGKLIASDPVSTLKARTGADVINIEI